MTAFEATKVISGTSILGTIDDTYVSVSTHRGDIASIKEYIEDSDYVGYGGEPILDICSDILERL